MIHLAKIQVYFAFYISDENLNLQTKKVEMSIFKIFFPLFLISKIIIL